MMELLVGIAIGLTVGLSVGWRVRGIAVTVALEDGEWAE